jgi:hypothetical protein
VQLHAWSKRRYLTNFIVLTSISEQLSLPFMMIIKSGRIREFAFWGFS